MEKKGESNRLVLVLYPFQGHINPMLELATILHCKGFSITIVHPEFNSPNHSDHPEFAFVSIPDHLSQTNIPPGDFLGVIKALNTNCPAPFELCMKRLLDEEGPNSRVACVVYDMFMFFAQNVADRLKLPGISVRTSAAATILSTSVFPNPHGKGYISPLDSMSEDSESDIQSLNIKDLIGSMPGNYAEEVLELRANLTRTMENACAIITNTMQFLEQETLTKIQEIFQAPIFSIGPFHKLAPDASSSLLKEDTSCISWLDKQAPKSVLYVSFGSMASMTEKEITEVAWGLANSEQPFLWVLRPGLVRGLDSNHLTDLLPESFGERGCIVKWAPQKQVLAHGSVGGFWTHCGWNSTLESICEGIPMLCRPFFGDQKLNVRYVCGIWKVGIELECEFERGKVEKAVRRLMVEKDGEAVRKRAMEFKEKADFCVRDGGSTYHSLHELVNHILSN